MSVCVHATVTISRHQQQGNAQSHKMNVCCAAAASGAASGIRLFAVGNAVVAVASTVANTVVVVAVAIAIAC